MVFRTKRLKSLKLLSLRRSFSVTDKVTVCLNNRKKELRKNKESVKILR